MGDQLVTPAELASFLQADLDTATATLLIEMATGKIQAACGQRLIQATDTTLIDVDPWDSSTWLYLPQRPTTAVTSVTIDGVAASDWVFRQQALYRPIGWSAWSTSGLYPAQVAVTSTHGYPAGTQRLQLARDMCFALAGAGYGNPGGGVSMEKIDDYQVSYGDADSRMQVTNGMRDMLRSTYGTSAYITGSRA